MKSDSDPALSRLYRNAAREEPPSWLDQRIAAAARGDALPQAEAGRAHRQARWQAPLALAAVLALAVSLTLMVDEELDRGAAEVHPQLPPQAMVAPQPAMPPAAGVESAQPGLYVQKHSMGEATQPTEAQRFRPLPSQPPAPPDTADTRAANERPEAERQRVPRAPDVERLTLERSPQGQITPSSPQWAAPAPAMRATVPEHAGRAAANDTARALADNEAAWPKEIEASRQAAEKERMRAEAGERRSAELAARASRYKLERPPASAVDAQRSADAAPAGEEARPPAALARGSAGARTDGERRDPRSPEQWLRDIERLRSEGRAEEVRTELEAFRTRYPDHPLPPSLK